ncbi:M23 family metallopeptidase [Salsuginibacillus kocurii]|uniref:M23 family metallopeptidase n=1 Tax=Salsuginibacillus kocurii TaxID=427078 RepID=UPI00035FD74C|nr:M23 family metallopeptidase [Salsuginibacillus kocurii]
MNFRQLIPLLIIHVLFLSCFPASLQAETENEENLSIHEERLNMYHEIESLTHVPWYWLAGVDAYERGLTKARKDRESSEGIISIYYAPNEWAGPLNPDLEDVDPTSITLFGGKGLDGNGDGKADREDDYDRLFTFANEIASYGNTDKDVRIGLWKHYLRDQTVRIITGHANVYRHHGHTNLEERAFPLPSEYEYSYQSTWGVKRGWGGRRIHEGTDLFAGHSTPVRSTSHGVVELMGWNDFGGWRIGIRDLNNVYHYYAHLSSFEDSIEQGTIVEPGDVIGYVGSSGYGKPGTQGKFPPHLHYGLYRDNGYTEWSFDPYPSLKQWEKQES